MEVNGTEGKREDHLVIWGGGDGEEGGYVGVGLEESEGLDLAEDGKGKDLRGRGRGDARVVGGGVGKGEDFQSDVGGRGGGRGVIGLLADLEGG